MEEIKELTIKKSKEGFYYTHDSHLHALKNSKDNKELACYLHMELTDKIVLDIGANAGAFNKLCFEKKM